MLQRERRVDALIVGRVEGVHRLVVPLVQYRVGPRSELPTLQAQTPRLDLQGVQSVLVLGGSAAIPLLGSLTRIAVHASACFPLQAAQPPLFDLTSQLSLRVKRVISNPFSTNARQSARRREAWSSLTPTTIIHQRSSPGSRGASGLLVRHPATGSWLATAFHLGDFRAYSGLAPPMNRPKSSEPHPLVVPVNETSP
jgi:hypothetical protein